MKNITIKKITIKNIAKILFFVAVCASCVSKAAFAAVHNIELVIFANKDGAYPQDESLIDDQEFSNIKDAVRIQSEKYYLSKNGIPKPLPPIYLSPRSWKLSDNSNKLRNNMNKKIVYHVAWQQELPAGKELAPIYLERIINDNPNSFINPKSKNNAFKGVLSIKKNRDDYQVRVDFILDDNKLNSVCSVFRLKANGVIKDNQAQYFEQPAFGALILVTKAN